MKWRVLIVGVGLCFCLVLWWQRLVPNERVAIKVIEDFFSSLFPLGLKTLLEKKKG